MSTANVSCLECGGEYRPTEEPGAFECEDCGHNLYQTDYIRQTADRLREYGQFEDVAEWLEHRAEQLEEGTANG